MTSGRRIDAVTDPAEGERSEQLVDARDDVAALVVPHDGAAPLDLVVEPGHGVGDIDAGGHADAGIAAGAVEVGDDEEVLGGERVGLR